MTEPQTDIPKTSWLDKLPAYLRPYARLMRMDRPIGTWLLLLPCYWGLALAGGSPDEWWLVIVFALGAVVMRGAGCTYNDIVDRDIDAQVARTATRPLPSGDVSLQNAWVFLALLLAMGLLVLLQLNRFAQGVAVASLLLVAAYPFMKRVTYWPQAWLGLTFNWGVLVAWAASRGMLELSTVLLYMAGIFWTLGYDTIYAHQDREDDALVGVKSTARALGPQTKPFLTTCYALTIALIVGAAAFMTTPVTLPFIILLGLAALHLGWQVRTLDIDSPANCLTRFKSNRDFGLLVVLALLMMRP